jgi:hypothetical protein
MLGLERPPFGVFGVGHAANTVSEGAAVSSSMFSAVSADSICSMSHRHVVSGFPHDGHPVTSVGHAASIATSCTRGE